MFRAIFLATGLFFFAYSYSQTTLKPNQKVSGVWDKEHSPYIIQDRVYIEEGKQLIIEPGVVVKLNSAYEDAYRSSQSKKAENRGSIVVNGTLIANGKPSDSIVFTKTGYNPYWGSIYFESKSKSEMSYCIIENSGGIYDLTGSNKDAFGAISTERNNSEFKHIYIRNSVRGFYIVERAAPKIDSIIISETKKDAILIKDQSAPVITNFIISKSGNGIFGQYNSPFIIENGMVSNCKYAGVRADSRSDFKMKNVVVANTKYGVRFEDSSPEISNCNIIQNRGCALAVNGFSKPVIMQSVLWDNQFLFENFKNIDILHCILQDKISETEISRSDYQELEENNFIGVPEGIEDFSKLLTNNPVSSLELVFNSKILKIGVVSK